MPFVPLLATFHVVVNPPHLHKCFGYRRASSDFIFG
jgi:hypothetical protein